MFSSGASYAKLKTNLRLAVSRLKLLEKKKTELAQKARKEIADYISSGKVERAKIRVEHIIREDYLVEAMEVVEMYCDLLLARFGLIQQMKNLDEGLAEAISSLIWVAPRLQTDVAELKIIADQLGSKYGKPYATACRENGTGTVSEKLMHKLSVQAPPKVLVEKYLIEIAKSHNVEYEPDPQVMGQAAEDVLLIDVGENNLNSGASGGPGGGVPAPPGFMGFPSEPYPPGPPPPPLNLDPIVPPADPSIAKPFNYPPLNPGGGYNIPPHTDSSDNNLEGFSHTDAQCHDEKKNLNFDMNQATGKLDYEKPPPYSVYPPDNSNENIKPAPRGKFPDQLDFPELPTVPSSSPVPGTTPSAPNPDSPDDDMDFDDLTRRFEELKKKK